MAEKEQTSLASRIKVEVTDGNMKAFLEIKAPETEGAVPITSKDIEDILSEKKVAFGINNALIDEIIEGGKWGEKLLIAKGMYPPPGKDAKFRFYFPTDKSFKPQIKEDGHIDYHESSIVNSVTKDTVLAKKIPAKAGSIGMNVLGDELSSITGKDISIRLGTGVYHDSEDDNIIKASVDGVVFYDAARNYLEVKKSYLVEGSVDFSTGNINVKSSIEIKEDVNPGFSVRTLYDVQINGSVDKAVISCEGSLKVVKGIIGDGKQLISVGGDIHASYINGQNVVCKGSLYVSSEIRNSNIECGGEVVLVKNNGVILGGKVFATDKITTAVIGNKYYIPTEVEVGILLDQRDKHDNKKEELVATKSIIGNYNSKIAQLSEQPGDEEIELEIAALKEECDTFVLHLDKLKKDILELEKQGIGRDAPVVCVTKTVYPGTIIKLRCALYEVKEPLSRVKFSVEDDVITYTTL
jgi:uncharacterized protein